MRTKLEIQRALSIACRATEGSETWNPETRFGALGAVMALRWVLGNDSAFAELLADAQRLFRTQAEEN